MAISATALLAIAGGSALLGTGAAGWAAHKASKATDEARKEEKQSYKDAAALLEEQRYRDPLTTVGNKALLKSMDERMRDQADALENRAVAGGATMENQLAARQMSNRTLSNTYSNLLQKEDARQDALDSKRLALDLQHSQNLQNSFYQDAQNYNQWGAAAGNSMMSLGSSALLAGGLG